MAARRMAGRPDKPPELPELLVAAVLLGCLGGGVLGAVAGGVAWPPLGIGFGAVAGVQLGALLGVLNAIAMWALGRSALAPTVAGAVALLVSAGSAARVLLVPGRLDLASSSALVIAAG